ncbi:unnamed protein product [Rotaria magnacalcarata]|uniref:Uncharacterized protein n=6 Tax=Rotaria magnacalcarata TaxID=392030 RepID=A0A819APW8_9BILA|nr:unnamed protein product [Rotaria magnacalcarata]CAF2069797.1 unnamed protein product [Rotaria magnacalcarata]CAF3789188.1 unnamed protein product [Rotaria magnacalcarata]CAF3818675.1 unnamed protein product [Rotaria magnacalcarata]
MALLNERQLNILNKLPTSPHPSTVRNISTPDLSHSDLDDNQKKLLSTLISQYPQVFTEQPGHTHVTKHTIELQPGTKPSNTQPYRLSPSKKAIVDQQLEEMLQAGHISPSRSPWAAPIVLSPKKDGSLRFCVDYRKLNANTIRTAYPMPRVDDTLDSLCQAKYISTLDLRSGYWQVELDPDSRDKTAFITHRGLYEFRVMPFGLSNAPATFQCLMDVVLAGLKWQSCLVYIDDIVVFSPTFEQHLRDLSTIFDRLANAGLTLKASKCDFCRKELKYLGHLITPDGIKPDPGLIDSVQLFPQPTKLKDLQSFLGLTGYYRKFIKNYATITEPLLVLLRSSQKSKRSTNHITWSDQCHHAFNQLKIALTQAPLLQAPNFNEPFILETDASDYGLGAILTQEFENQKFVIAYASRTQTAAERNYFPTEKEALAIFWATKHFRPYLEGTTIYIRSDCRALQWLLNTKDLSGRLARWAISLSAFNIVDIKYKPGKTNTNCDTLSRYPLSPHLTILNTTPPTSPLLNLWNNCTLLDNIREEQYNDAQLRPIVDILSNDAHPLHHKFHPPFLLINGILYRYRSPPYNPHQRLTGLRHLLVIPHSLQSQLLTWTHDHPTAGHCGREKTLYRLSSRVYWKTIRKDVIQYIRSCHLCQQYKYDNRTLTASLQMHIVHEPWHTIGVDIMGPFPVTQRQKQYLLVVVDYFTRWVELFPLRTTISSHIADILVDEIICRWGCPTYILSDNGPQFVSELFTHICSSLGIQTKNTSNYHPQTNMTERVNRNLKPMIAQYAQENTHSWDRHLSKLALSIRTSINETTGETPAYLNFGRDPKLPIDLLLTEPSRNQPTLPTSIPAEIDTYKQHLREALLTAHRIAQEHNEVRKLQQKTKYDQHSSHRSFKEGHLVWVSIPSPLKHGKLDPQYQGPCRIIQVLSPTSFIIHRLSDGVNLGATNIDRIKPFYSPNMTHTTTQTGINRHQSAAPIQPLMSVNVDNVNNLPTPHIPPNNHSLPLSSTPLPHRYQHPVRIRKQPNRLNL